MTVRVLRDDSESGTISLDIDVDSPVGSILRYGKRGDSVTVTHLGQRTVTYTRLTP